jgi:Zn-dependent protease
MVWEILTSTRWSAGTPLALLLAAMGAVVAIVVNGAAQAWLARWRGDVYPFREGRASLLPADHYDPVGSTAVVLFGWGWAKPVAVHPGYLRSPRVDRILVALSGPAANILLAVALAFLLRFEGLPQVARAALAMVAYLNLMLAFFSLLPFPPLAGKTVLAELLPHDAASAYERFMDKWGFLILLAIIFVLRVVMHTLVTLPAYLVASAASGLPPAAFDALLRSLG